MGKAENLSTIQAKFKENGCTFDSEDHVTCNKLFGWGKGAIKPDSSVCVEVGPWFLPVSNSMGQELLQTQFLNKEGIFAMDKCS